MNRKPLTEPQWHSAETQQPLPHRRLELRDENGIEVEGWFDGAVFYSASGMTGSAVAEWRYRRYEK